MPYIITTKTAPKTGSMACCHSTIGAGKCGHMIEQSRVVVATLEEARNTAVMAAMASHAFGYGSQDAIAACRALGEDGGWVGPLPDGTTIEVRAIDRATLLTMVPERDSRSGDTSLLAAFNAS